MKALNKRMMAMSFPQATSNTQTSTASALAQIALSTLLRISSNGYRKVLRAEHWRQLRILSGSRMRRVFGVCSPAR
jgi:hypothetical protein